MMKIQCTLVTVNAWIVNNLSFVNIFGETGQFFYNINYMLNSEHLSLVNKIGDKTEFTITRVHCIWFHLNLSRSYVFFCLIVLIFSATPACRKNKYSIFKIQNSKFDTSKSMNCWEQKLKIRFITTLRLKPVWSCMWIFCTFNFKKNLLKL